MIGAGGRPPIVTGVGWRRPASRRPKLPDQLRDHRFDLIGRRPLDHVDQCARDDRAISLPDQIGDVIGVEMPKPTSSGTVIGCARPFEERPASSSDSSARAPVVPTSATQ